MKKRVADIIMEILADQGIHDCFAVVGGGAMHLDNALALSKDIRTYFSHHEQACSIAADAYARISGKIAAVCVTSGPGGTNAITGVLGAWQDSLPMLILSGQVRYATSVHAVDGNLRYRGIQEYDIIPSVKNITKYAVMLTDPLSVKRELEKAIRIAMEGRRGPVWIDIPMDVQSAIIEEDDMYLDMPSEQDIPAINKAELDAMLTLLRSAARPCILAGNGIVNSGNREHFFHFVDQMQIPVIGACIAADVMYQEHPLFYGMSGSIGPRTGNFILQNSDMILSLGCPLGFKVTGFAPEHFAPNAKIIMVDIDENEYKKLSIPIELFLHSDLTAFFSLTAKQDILVSTPKDWLDYCNNLRNRFSPFEGADNVLGKDRVSAYQFWKIYQELEPENSVTVLGNNTANSAKLQIGVRRRNNRLIASNNCGSMGADLPEAFGAAIATGHEIICSTGDGSIMMNLQELQSIHHYNLPIKIIVFSNNGYAAIRQTSKNFFEGLNFGCTPESGVSFPSFQKVAETFGFPYRKCKNNNEIEESLRWLFEHPGQVFLEVEQAFDDPITPKVMSRINPDGTFSTPALHDMWPFIEQEELDELMLW